MALAFSMQAEISTTKERIEKKHSTFSILSYFLLFFLVFLKPRSV